MGKRVALYVRVSTDEQAKSGYSIADQNRELLRHAESEGYEVVETIVDDGYSGASRERPGLERVLELAEAGEMELAIATKRDRWFRSRLYRLMLDEDLAELGARLVALNDTGNRIGDGVQDDFAEWEREVITERTRVGRFGRARSGRLLIGCRPLYGYRLTENGRYEVHPVEMEGVRLVLGLAAEGEALRAIGRALHTAGYPSPTGKEHWHPHTVKRVVLQEAYRPHVRAELEALVEEGVLLREVLDTLDPGAEYGVVWYGKERHRKNRAGTRKSSPSPRKERVAVPVPHSGIETETVARARAAISGNARPARADGRLWSLTGGVAFCACGRRLVAKRTTSGGRAGPRKVYHYLTCSTYAGSGGITCEHTRCHRAGQTEERVAEFVLGLLRNPELLREEAERQAEGERRRLRRADREADKLRGVLRGLEDKRERLMDLALNGPFGKDEIARRAASLEAERNAVERELAGLGGDALEGRLRELEELPDLVEEYLHDLPYLVGRQRVVRDHVTLPEECTADNPLGLIRLTPDSVRHKTNEEIEGERLAAENERSARLRWVYEAIGLAVTAHKDGTLVLRWSCGSQTLPAVTGFESPVLGRIYAPGE
jgi:site-specific DNA recombinase